MKILKKFDENISSKKLFLYWGIFAPFIPQNFQGRTINIIVSVKNARNTKTKLIGSQKLATISFCVSTKEG